MSRVYLTVIDGLGIGAQEDSVNYGDASCNTMAHVSDATGVRLPEFQKLGLGNIFPLKSVSPVESPQAAFGKMREVSPGKDSTTGHWEIAGIHLKHPFPTYPDGFPADVVSRFVELTGVTGILVNKPYSGTDVINDFGAEHLTSGKPIVYTSSDSVFQIACHVDVVSVEKQYEWCRLARKEIMINGHGVGRVIARPFAGQPGKFYRLSDQRHDFSSIPTDPFLPKYLMDNGVETWSVGKVIDLFAERGFSHSCRTKSNAEGITRLLSLMSAEVKKGFVFVNLIDTDQLYGHRNDPHGYAGCLEEIDRALPAIRFGLKRDDLLIITGDHGNDPTTPGTDHTREFVPLLVYPSSKAAACDLGIRKSFSDIACSVCDYFNLDIPFKGDSFV